MMTPKLALRFLREPSPRLLWRFLHTFAWQGRQAVNRFYAEQQQGTVFPPFVFISLTDQCNLHCEGCWVEGEKTAPRELSSEQLHALIQSCRARGNRFFGLLGGEPLLYPNLAKIATDFPDCYFQIFTNGTLITEKIAAELAAAGNITVVISIEGTETESDRRRGGEHVYARALEALAHCTRHGLITGVATSVCRKNLDEVLTETFIFEMIRRGALYLWYYIYRPVGPRPHPELALNADDILRTRKFLVEQRSHAPILLIDAYWDHLGRALCPAAVGVSHHIGPGGDMEPCPPIQFSRDHISDGDPAEILTKSAFLRHFREMSSSATRGCVLLEQPDRLLEWVKKENARDSSGRNTAIQELNQMKPRPGHHLAGQEIPEKHWLYRYAKKHWFFGFGAYG